ncbi:hypothetical protein M1567_01100 [Candidatus Marsarchaeota archaeon]|nr:hypothetical protein [Candidatus Marsarchaeota archaeon]
MYKSIQLQEAGLKFRMDSVQLIKRFASTSPKMAEFLKGSDYVIALRDLAEISVPNAKYYEVQEIENEELFAMLRGARDKAGNPVYKDAHFSVEPHDAKNIYGIQTFISVDKLAEAEKRDKFLSDIGATAHFDGTSYAIKANAGSKICASILVPPVVIDYRSADLEGPMKIVEHRIANGDRIRIKGVEGTVTFDMAAALAGIRDAISKSDTIRTVKDGTHRAYITYCTGRQFNAITISNQTEMPTNIPVRFGMMVLSKEKPEPEDRYPGYTPTANSELKQFGIDS